MRIGGIENGAYSQKEGRICCERRSQRPTDWWQNVLHGQRALLLKGTVLFKDRVVVTDVPYHMTR
jgi:hypothetical protein